MGHQLAGPVLDRVPIDQSGIAPVGDDRAQPFVGLQLVDQQIARDKLVVELPQRHGEALHRVFRDDFVGLLDQGERPGLEVDIGEGFPGH